MPSRNLFRGRLFYFRIPQNLTRVMSYKSLRFLIVAAFFGSMSTSQGQDCAFEAIATLYTELWSDEISFTISDDNGILAQGQGLSDYSAETTSFCLDSITGCLVLEMNDSFGDGWNGAFLEIYLPSVGIYLGNFTLDAGNFQAVTFGDGCENGVGDIHGCTDPTAFNFNPAATVEDGSCVYDCECEDFDEPVCAITNAGELVTYPNLCEAFCDQVIQIVGFGDCDNLPVHGCTDPEALNFNPEATADDGSCLYPCECDDVFEPVCGYDYITGDYVTYNNSCEAMCAGAWIAFEGDCANLPVWGCTDSEALNYNPEANNDDGSCVTLPECAEGEFLLTIETVSPDSLIELGFAANLYWTLTTADGNYVDLVYTYDEFQQANGYGCAAPGCYNFFLNDYGWAPGAGSVNVTVNGTTTNYSVPAEQYLAGFGLGVETEGCELTFPGCTDAEALNYNATATVDDGSCQYPFTCDEGTPGQLYVCTFSGGENVGLEVVADDGSLLYSQSGFGDFAIVYIDVCLQDSTCYTATLTDLSGTGMGWNGGYFWVSDGYQDLVHEALPNGQVASTVEFSLDGTCGGVPSNDIYGCTDPTAWNYNPWATLEDGSCLYDNGEIYGCTDPVATNYNPLATVDDGSCVFPSICEDMSEVLLVLDGGTWPGEIALLVINEAGEVVMEMDGYTGIMQGCVPAGCYTVEMHDSFGDGWNGGWAEMFVDGEPMGTMTLEEGDFGSATVGVGGDCGEFEGGFTGDLPGGYEGTIWFEAFPNPGVGDVNVIADDFDMNEPVVVRIYDATGKIVVDEVKHRDDARVWTFDASSWSTGMYIIRATQGGKYAQSTWMKAQ